MNILETVVFAEGENVDTAAQDTTATTAHDASGTEQQAQGNPVTGMIMSFLPFVLIIVLLYFMMIRPQRKREKEAKAMLNAMKVGDKVVTIGGICGKVSKIKDEFIWIETGNIGTQDEKSVLKMERDAVRTVNPAKD